MTVLRLLGHFVKDFTKTVFFFLILAPPPILSFSIRPWVPHLKSKAAHLNFLAPPLIFGFRSGTKDFMFGVKGR